MRGDNVCVLSLVALPVAEKSYMCAPSGVMFDSLNFLFARSHSVEVNRSDPSLVSTTSMSNGHVSIPVSTSYVLTFARKRKWEIGTAWIEMVVDGSNKVASSWAARFELPQYILILDLLKVVGCEYDICLCVGNATCVSPSLYLRRVKLSGDGMEASLA